MGVHYMLLMSSYSMKRNLTDAVVNTYNNLPIGGRGVSRFQVTYFHCLHSSDKTKIFETKEELQGR